MRLPEPNADDAIVVRTKSLPTNPWPRAPAGVATSAPGAFVAGIASGASVMSVVSVVSVLSVASVAAIFGLLPWTDASAETFPARKAGLWEMKTTGGPVGARTVQQCIDAATDDLLRTRSNEGQNCSRPEVERSGSRYKVRTLCENNGVKSTVDGEYTMSGDTRYTGDMKMTFDPPMSGVSEMNMKMEGRWLGACKAGMKPGDVVMQGMPRMNVLEMDKP